MKHALLGRNVRVRLDAAGLVVGGYCVGTEERLNVRVTRDDGTVTTVTVAAEFVEVEE